MKAFRNSWCLVRNRDRGKKFLKIILRRRTHDTIDTRSGAIGSRA